MPHPTPPPRAGGFSLFRQIGLRPRLFTSGAVGVAVALLLDGWPGMFLVTRMIIGWNAFACLYLVLALLLMARSDHESMRKRAVEQDEGKLLILALVVLAALATLSAIVVELSAVKDMHGAARYGHVALAVLTIATSWLFTHVMFALHYAHDFYASRVRGQDGGLGFPGDEPPHYSDFLYFACIIGTSAQTADVSLTSTAMRRTGLLHCLLAFIFNTTLLALTINIASGLF